MISEKRSKENSKTRRFDCVGNTTGSLRPAKGAASLHSIQMKCSNCEEEESLQMKPEEKEQESIQMKPALQSSPDGKQFASNAMSQKLSSTKGAGKALPDGIGAEMSRKIGSDFSGVRVHTDAQAVQMNREVGAQAFTYGSDIYFDTGKYDPGSSKGKRLLAHELTHVVQQGKATENAVVQKQEQAVGAHSFDLYYDLENILGPVLVGRSVSVSRTQQLELFKYLKCIRKMAPEQEVAVKGILEQYFPDFGNQIWEDSKRSFPDFAGTPVRSGRKLEGEDEKFVQSLILKAGRSRDKFEKISTSLTDYSRASRQIGDRVKDKLLLQAGKYENAFNRFSGVVSDGRAEAQNQAFWMNIAVGVGAGVTVGLLAAWVLPTTAAGWFALSLGELAGVMGSAAGQSLVGGLAAAKVGEMLTPAGTDLQATGMNPILLKMKIWRKVSQIYRDGLIYVDHLKAIHQMSLLSQAVLGEIKLYKAGAETKVNLYDLDFVVSKLGTAYEALSPLTTIINGKLGNLQKVLASVECLSDYSEKQMEEDIWVLWIADLDDPSVLDLDAIEDYLHKIGILGSKSILGVSFGGYTSGSDEDAAQRSAKRLAKPIKTRIKSLS
ncbi:MAG: DUF4157 domain-containing protein [Marinifilaceae bacterium]